MVKKVELTWTSVNTDDAQEMAEFDEQEDRKAGERVKAAFERLQELGILDAKGELIGDELPPDMQPGAKRDVGG
jgi:hypothetical protein